jgi:hypothetical protein
MLRRLAPPAFVLALAAVLFGMARRILNRATSIAHSEIRDPAEHTTMGADGAVRSIQAADLTLPEAELDRLWTPEYLERLARTYWRFLTRATLGIIRVSYTEGERFVCVIGRPLVLLSFQAPEYEMNAERGIVRWRIESGVLVSSRGRGGKGYLEIDVRRCRPDADEPAPARARLHIEVEVANFYPMIASSISGWVYRNTQSRIHVIVTHGFLRSLANLDLAESKVGRLAGIDEVPDPPVGLRHPERDLSRA